MVICVLATVSSETGALTIYKQLLGAIGQYGSEHSWHVFIADGMPCPAINGVSYHLCQTKGLNRFLFDFVGFNKIIKKLGIAPDVVLSLQNTSARCKASRFVVYFHQALALYKYKVNLRSNFAKTYLFYHYFYPLYIRLLLNKKTFVAVQTNQIRNGFSNRLGFPKDRIGVYFPETDKIDVFKLDPYNYEADTYNFIYPATPFAFKEHITLAYAVNATYQQDSEQAKKIRIHLTISLGELPDMDSYIKQNGLENNFIYHGRIPHQQLLSMVKSSDGLLFPSVIETLGLPLLEAASLGTPVIANDLEYVHEVLNGYDGVKYVKVHDYKEWGRQMLACIPRRNYAPYSLPEDNSWKRLMKLITEGIIQNK